MQPVNKVPVKEENSYDQGKAVGERGTDVKVGPAYAGGSLKSNPQKGGGINRSLRSGTSE